MEQNETKRRNETETSNIIHQTLKSRINLEPKDGGTREQLLMEKE
jgi:hypothetical protein